MSTDFTENNDLAADVQLGLMSSNTLSETSPWDDVKCNLHDCVALGAFEYGLPLIKIRSVEAEPAMKTEDLLSKDVDTRLKKVVVLADENEVHTETSSEIYRLPLLLRILSQSRPLSSIQSLGDILHMQNDGTSKLDTSSSNDDPLLDDIVARLEDRAAVYAAAERVQMVSCHLAPAACHQVSKLSPLAKRKDYRKTNLFETTPYDTTELEIVAQDLVNPSSLGNKKQRRFSLTKQSTVNARGDAEGKECDDEQNDIYDLRGSRAEEPDDSDCDSKAEATSMTSSRIIKRKRSRSTRILSISNVSEDSPEYNVLKVLHELISLTVTSLQRDDGYEKLIDKEDSKDERASMAQGNYLTLQKGGSIALPKMDDSILSQPVRRVKLVKNSSSGGSVMMTSSSADLASTVVALMHHAPVLLHRQVAIAFCRAALPQTPLLISRMGANSPAAIQSLLDGCVTVYCRVIGVSSLHNGALRNSQLSNIASLCVQSVRLLAKLSPREACRTMSTLRRRNSMVELQLELMIQHDALTAFLFLNQHLSSGAEISIVKECGTVVQPISNLCGYLECNVSLLRDTLRCINDHLSADIIPIPRLSIILSAYTRILSQVSMSLFLADDGIRILQRSLASLRRKFDRLHEHDAQNLQHSAICSSGPEYGLLVVAIISTHAILLSQDECQKSISGAHLKDLVDFYVALLHTRVLLVRLFLALSCGDEDSLYDIILSSIKCFKARKVVAVTSQRNESFRSHLKKLCTWAVSSSALNLEFIEDGLFLEESSVLLYPSFCIQILKYKQFATFRATRLLARVLNDTDAVILFLHDPLVLDFFENCVSVSLCREEAKLPVITPIQIQTLATTLLLPQWENLEIPVLQFVMQLLYSFYFFEQAPSSPFCIDPRVLPLNRILELGARFKSFRRIHSSVLAKLSYFIDVYCPEVRRFHRFKMLKSRERWFCRCRPTILVKPNKQEFTRILRQTIASDSQSDAFGYTVECAFLEASLYLSDADLLSASVSALVTSPSSLPLYYTYPMLYRDPLVMLKCPLSVWNCRGTRRVVLSVLSRLLVSNEFIVRKIASCQEAANELISSRNEIVLRCLLRVLTSPIASLESSTLVCVQTCGLIRKVVALNDGLTALLIKQGLSDAEIYWLTESVPELALDLSTIQGMLADKSSLSAANRLVVANCCTWIAISYGHRSDGYAEGIVHSALLHLISSFFLILGPIGVPVNALVGQGTDLDATQVARKATFSLLGSLQKIKLFRTRLKGETLPMLQKFIGMCKGEAIVGSLQTSITASQKSLLKDLVDVVKKAMESMGSSNMQD